MDNPPILIGEIHYKWPCSIAMLVYQRVMQLRFELKQRDQLKKVPSEASSEAVGDQRVFSWSDQAFKIGDGIHSKLKDICFLKCFQEGIAARDHIFPYFPDVQSCLAYC